MILEIPKDSWAIGAYAHNLTFTSNTLLIYSFVNPSSAVTASDRMGVGEMMLHGMAPHKQPNHGPGEDRRHKPRARNNYCADQRFREERGREE